MKIYVLTLKGETERRENVIKEFQKIGIKPTFFEGIDGASSRHGSSNIRKF